MKDRSAIVLSGGKSRRFEDDSTDKALKKLGEETLLRRVIKSARNVAGEVIISVNNESRKRKYKKILREENLSNIRIVADEDVPCKGPLRGIMTCLKHAAGELALTVPCDVPLIKPEILNHLFQSIEDCDVAIPTWGNGNLEALVCVYSRIRMAQIAETLCLLGRKRPDDLFRSAPKIKFVSVEKDLKPLDSNLDSFVNINHPQDIENLPRRKHRDDLFSETRIYETETEPKILEDALQKSGGNKEKLAEYLEQNLNDEGGLFWRASVKKRKAKIMKQSSESKNRSREIIEKFKKAGKMFEDEADIHIGRNILFLAGHTLFDAEKCWREADNKEKAGKIREKAERLFDKMDHEKNVSEDSPYI